jgi:hypothetical protein
MGVRGFPPFEQSALEGWGTGTLDYSEFHFEADEGGDGVGGTGTEAALHGEALVDVDFNFGGEAESVEGQGHHLPGGVAVVSWDTLVI